VRAQLKLRAALMPEVVSPVEALEAGAASRRPELVGPGGKPRQRSWAVSPKLFPCELSAEAQAAIAGVHARWGHRHSICTCMRLHAHGEPCAWA
jgi:hypothetical protein